LINAVAGQNDLWAQLQQYAATQSSNGVNTDSSTSSGSGPAISGSATSPSLSGDTFFGLMQAIDGGKPSAKAPAGPPPGLSAGSSQLSTDLSTFLSDVGGKISNPAADALTAPGTSVADIGDDGSSAIEQTGDADSTAASAPHHLHHHHPDMSPDNADATTSTASASNSATVGSSIDGNILAHAITAYTQMPWSQSTALGTSQTSMVI
jgi:hypothetical protein